MTQYWYYFNSYDIGKSYAAHLNNIFTVVMNIVLKGNCSKRPAVIITYQQHHM